MQLNTIASGQPLGFGSENEVVHWTVPAKYSGSPTGFAITTVQDIVAVGKTVAVVI
jgi:hypothetical protein